MARGALEQQRPESLVFGLRQPDALVVWNGIDGDLGLDGRQLQDRASASVYDVPGGIDIRAVN